MSGTRRLENWNLVWDTSTYGPRDSREVDEIHRSIERMCWHCVWVEQEGDHECASRELVTGHSLAFEGTSLSSPRRTAERAEAIARIEARWDTNRHMQSMLIKAALRAGMPIGIHWDVEPTGVGRTPLRSVSLHPAFKRFRAATRAAARIGSRRHSAPERGPRPRPSRTRPHRHPPGGVVSSNAPSLHHFLLSPSGPSLRHLLLSPIRRLN